MYGVTPDLPSITPIPAYFVMVINAVHSTNLSTRLVSVRGMADTRGGTHKQSQLLGSCGYSGSETRRAAVTTEVGIFLTF